MLPSGNPAQTTLYIPPDSAFNAPSQMQFGGLLGSGATGGDQTSGLPQLGDAAPGYAPDNFSYLPGPPRSQPFMHTLALVTTQELPKIDALARSALEGITRAFEPHVDPGQTAATLQALRAALGNLYDVLKESGVGALPLQPDLGDTSASALLSQNATADPRLEALTQQVNAIFRADKNNKERAKVVLDVLQAKPVQQANRAQ